MKIGVPGACALALALGALLPRCVFAQVIISEIMYNPSGSDIGREWVELYNPGSSDVTMVGGTVKGSWRIGDTSNHTLTDPAGGTGRGTLTIPAGGYLIITNDPTLFISGEYAGGTYPVVKSSISLGNTSGNVTLTDGTGATIDSFSYAKDMGGSDDGTSLQKSGDAWIAALPTPGSANATSPYVVPVDTGSSQGDQTSTTTATSTNTAAQTQTLAPVSAYVAPPVPKVFADAGADRSVIVGADVELKARSYDRDRNTIDATRYAWNFGDGTTGEGASVLHHFDYPGRYAVVLTVVEVHDSASDEMIITAEPAHLGFSVLPDGGVLIENQAGRDLDLSRWIVRSAELEIAPLFILPENSKILRGSSMHIAPSTLGFHATESSDLDYPNGMMALHAGQKSIAETPAPTIKAEDTSTQSKKERTSVEAEEPPAPKHLDVQEDEKAVSEAVTTVGATVSQSAAVVEAEPVKKYAWWAAISILVLAVCGAVVMAKKHARNEWDIVEQIDE